MRPRRHPFRAHLQRRIFLWFGATILTAGMLAAGVSHWLGGGWTVHHELDESDGRSPRTETVCVRRAPWSFPGRGAIPLVFSLVTLWGISGLIARRLSRPFLVLADEAAQISRGDLGARPASVRERDGEARVVADVLAQMKGRIRKQLDDQRALLAAVSHEIRSPLARMRLLLEFARQGKVAPLDEIEKEIVEMDALVGDLLASSRIDFAAIGRHALDAAVLCTEALSRSGVSPEVLSVETVELAFEGDATLVSRAISNLLENAKRHGRGVVALRVHRRDHLIVMDVDDAGTGLTPGEEKTIFDPFARKHSGRDPSSAGLGLALVKRIAEAHGGEAHAVNRPSGGARFGFSVVAS